MHERIEVIPVDLSRPRPIHLVGVGGAGISAIAVILAAMGHRVSGSDVNETPAWPHLIEAGVSLSVVPAEDLFDAARDAGAEIVAYSTAWPPPPGLAGPGPGAAFVDRASMLAAICAERPTVAVSGTHGKTSTTAMVATVLEALGADPSYLIGAQPVAPLTTAARWGGPGGTFVVEADESDGSFEVLGASTVVVTNIEEDHLDHWGSIEAIEAAFDRFVRGAEVRVIDIDDPRAARLAAAHGAVTVGESEGADYRIHDVVVERLSTRFGLTVGGREIDPVTIDTPGRHHAHNATAAIAVAVSLGADIEAAAAAIAPYRGVRRRFEVVGEAAGVTVVDDYAHNPGKVRALVSSAREAGWDRVVVAFQPHRYTRTRDLGPAFVAGLEAADVVAVTDIYGAGETPIDGVSGLSLVEGLLDARPWRPTAWLPTLDDVVTWAAQALRPGDLFLTVGAGDVHQLGSRVLARLGGGERS